MVAHGYGVGPWLGVSMVAPVPGRGVWWLPMFWESQVLSLDGGGHYRSRGARGAGNKAG